MKIKATGFWRRIVALAIIPQRFRVRVGLECGHSFLVHLNVRQHNGLYFDPVSQKNFFCEQCRDPKVNLPNKTCP
jgi:hypothetical protein